MTILAALESKPLSRPVGHEIKIVGRGVLIPIFYFYKGL